MRIAVRIQVEDHEAEIEVEVERNGLPSDRAADTIEKVAALAITKAVAAAKA